MIESNLILVREGLQLCRTGICGRWLGYQTILLCHCLLFSSKLPASPQEALWHFDPTLFTQPSSNEILVTCATIPPTRVNVVPSEVRQIPWTHFNGIMICYLLKFLCSPPCPTPSTLTSTLYIQLFLHLLHISLMHLSPLNSTPRLCGHLLDAAPSTQHQPFTSPPSSLFTAQP